MLMHPAFSIPGQRETLHLPGHRSCSACLLGILWAMILVIYNHHPKSNYFHSQTDRLPFPFYGIYTQLGEISGRNISQVVLLLEARKGCASCCVFSSCATVAALGCRKKKSGWKKSSFFNHLKKNLYESPHLYEQQVAITGILGSGNYQLINSGRFFDFCCCDEL